MLSLLKLFSARTSFSSPITTTLICAAFSFAVPQIAWSQTDSATNQAKRSAEGDRLLSSGTKAYEQGQISEASSQWEQALVIYARELGKDHPDTLQSMHNLGKIYLGLGNYGKARELYETTLKLRRVRLGEDHPDTLRTMNNLALAYGALDELDMALSLQEQALKYMRSKLGEDHPDTLRLISGMALTYGALGQHDKALLLEEQNLKRLRAKLGDGHISTLSAMHDLAGIYGALDQHDKALVIEEQFLALCRAQLGADHSSTLGAMHALAKTYLALGQFDKSLAMNELITELRRANLGENHPDTLDSMDSLANTYRALGQYDKTLALNEETLKLRRAKFGNDYDTLGLLSQLTGTYRTLEDFEQALKTEELTLKVMRNQLGEDHPERLVLMTKLAGSYRSVGRFGRALEVERQILALMRVRLGEDHPSTLGSMKALALSYSHLGQYDRALTLEEKGLALMRAKLGEDHPDTLGLMNQMANTFNTIGQHDKALSLNEQTLKLRLVKLNENHPDTLVSMDRLASSYRALGQIDRAMALYLKAVKLWQGEALVVNDRDRGTGINPDYLSMMDNLASTYSVRGDFDAALVVGEAALDLRRSFLGEEHADTTASMSSVANVYSALGQFDKALVLNEQALKLRHTRLGEHHPDTLTSMADLASIYSDLGQHDKALKLIPGIVAGSERLRALPGLETEQRQSLFAKYSDHYQKYAALYASAGRPTEAFDLGDLSKARTLTDSIKTQTALRSLPADEQLSLQGREALAGRLHAQIDKLNAQGTRDSGALLALQKQLDAHNVAHLKLVADLNSRYPKYAQITHIKAATASQAKQLLGRGEVFVSYLLTTKGMAQAFVLDARGEAKWVDLGEIKNHAKTVAAYRELVAPSTGEAPSGHLVALKDGGYQWLEPGQPAPAGASNVADELKVLNRYWHDTLIKPILPLAGQYKRWIISPDKDLALLPFDTLAESFDAAGKPAQTLVQTRNITLVQSFAVFALLKQREADYATLPRPKELFAMGNAVYDSGWAEARGIRRGGGKRGYAMRGGDVADQGNAPAPLKAPAEQYAMSQFAWQNLPGTADEIMGVSAVFAGNKKGQATDVDSYLGPEASEGKLQQINAAGKLKDYRYLLFSAHGYLSQNPALSSLVLSQQGNPPGIDGYVTASEWPLYDIRSDLTVLSACDTGVGRAQAGESVMGLPYALFVAGNKNTLLSLWPVEDNATAEFMRRFFTRIKAGAAQPDALRQTKQEFMQHPQWSQPRFWSAFVLYGV